MEKITHVLFIASFFNFSIHGCWSLRDVRLEIPDYVRPGREVRLRCEYDLEKDALYAVKWYKGSPFQEFYRYLPKEVPPGKTFQFPGITVNVESSNAHDVVLSSVPLEITGNYKCVVSVESTFQTLSASADLKTLVIGDDRPLLQLDRTHYQNYHPGDTVTANCQAPPSLPPANITWYLNDDKVTDDLARIKTEIETRGADGMGEDSPLTQWSFSVIEFDLSGNVTPVFIKCRARVFTAYDQNSSVLTVQPIPRKLSGPDTLLRSTGCRRRWQPVFLMTVAISFYFVQSTQGIEIS